MTEIAAIIACLILLLLTLFQCTLIAGLPFGNFAWGGANRVLPTKLRIGSVVSIILYIIFAIVILGKAGFISLFTSPTIAMWILTVYFFIGVFMNGISRSKKERAVMTPVSLLLALLCLVVALS